MVFGRAPIRQWVLCARRASGVKIDACDNEIKMFRCEERFLESFRSNIHMYVLNVSSHFGRELALIYSTAIYRRSRCTPADVKDHCNRGHCIEYVRKMHRTARASKHRRRRTEFSTTTASHFIINTHFFAASNHDNRFRQYMNVPLLSAAHVSRCVFGF